jgi:hypothetical protein
MNSSIFRADATTHLKIVATALLAASVVVWVGLAARISLTPIAASVTALARPSTVPMHPWPAPVEPSMIAMLKNHRL